MIKAQNFACFVSILMLLTIMLSIVLFAMPLTSAEETTDQYVVFNQHVNNGNFSNGTTGFSFTNLTGSVSDGIYTCQPKSTVPYDWSCLIGFSVKYVNSHKYFIRLDCKSTKSNSYFTLKNNNGIVFTQNILNTMSTYSGIFSSSASGTMTTYIYSDFASYSPSDTFSLSNINIIDLTEMFGVGNEPTIDVCRNLFVSNYYPYNVDGTVISLDGFTNYSLGVSDTISSLLVTYSNNDIYNLLSPVRFLGNDNSSSTIFNGSLMLFNDNFLSFGSLLSAGTIVNLSCDYVTTRFFVDSSSYKNTTLSIGYTIGSTYYPLQTFYVSKDVTSYKMDIDVVLPVDLSGLVLRCYDDSQGGSYLALRGTVTLSFKAYNYNVFLQNSYDSGVDAGYATGYSAGYNKGLSIGSDKQYSFSGLLDAVVQAPITALIGSYDSSGNRVGGLLNFEFLGVNLSFFFTGLFSVTIVIVVIRFILARK